MTGPLQAVRPPRGAVVHLVADDYEQPHSYRGRSVRDACLCGMNRPHGKGQPVVIVPLSQALNWTAMTPSDDDPRPAWRWCAPCIGRAVERDVLLAQESR